LPIGKPFYFIRFHFISGGNHYSEAVTIAGLCASPSSRSRRKPQAYGIFLIMKKRKIKKPIILSAPNLRLYRLLEEKILKGFSFIAYAALPVCSRLQQPSARNTDHRFK